jgi:hypothetical protein
VKQFTGTDTGAENAECYNVELYPMGVMIVGKVLGERHDVLHWFPTPQSLFI